MDKNLTKTLQLPLSPPSFPPPLPTSTLPQVSHHVINPAIMRLPCCVETLASHV